MKDITVFKNVAFGELEIIEENDKFWFPAVRCAEILGYQNPRDAVLRHCKGDGVVKHDVIDSLGRIQEKKYITEGNLYRLIVNSQLETAQRFESWVFDEVLPMIRKTGGYKAEKSPFERAAMLAKCPNSRLEIVLDVLRRGGYEVPDVDKNGKICKKEHNSDVINTLIDLVENHGVYKGDIAHRMDVTYSAICMYMSGKRYPSKKHEKKLIEVLEYYKEKIAKEQAGEETSPA